jgi:hypothetical protein
MQAESPPPMPGDHTDSVGSVTPPSPADRPEQLLGPSLRGLTLRVVALVIIVSAILSIGAFVERQHAGERNLASPKLDTGELVGDPIDPLQDLLLNRLSGRSWKWTDATLARAQDNWIRQSEGAIQQDPEEPATMGARLGALDDTQLLEGSGQANLLLDRFASEQQSAETRDFAALFAYIRSRYLAGLEGEVERHACGAARRLIDRPYRLLSRVELPASVVHNRPEQATTNNQVFLLHALFQDLTACLQDASSFHSLAMFLLKPRPSVDPELLQALKESNIQFLNAWFHYVTAVRMLQAHDFAAAQGEFQQVVDLQQGNEVTDLARLGQARALFWDSRSRVQRTPVEITQAELDERVNQIRAAGRAMQSRKLTKDTEDYAIRLSTQATASLQLARLQRTSDE